MRKTTRLLSIAGCVLALSPFASVAPPATGLQDKVAIPKADPDLAKLSWIAGDWSRVTEDETLEERWEPALGNAMVGTFRWMKKGVGWVYEFLLIEKRGDKLTFYLRHFGPGSVAFEKAKEPLDFPLKSVEKRRVVFEHPTRQKMKRLIYEQPNDGEMIVRVEGVRGDGEVSASVFRFVRAK